MAYGDEWARVEIWALIKYFSELPLKNTEKDQGSGREARIFSDDCSHISSNRSTDLLKGVSAIP